MNHVLPCTSNFDFHLICILIGTLYLFFCLSLLTTFSTLLTNSRLSCVIGSWSWIFLQTWKRQLKGQLYGTEGLFWFVANKGKLPTWHPYLSHNWLQFGHILSFTIHSIKGQRHERRGFIISSLKKRKKQRSWLIAFSEFECFLYQQIHT